MTGSVISTETNTGTAEEENQKSARRMKDTTGVARTRVKGKLSRRSKRGMHAVENPRTIDRKNEMKKAERVRSVVKPI